MFREIQGREAFCEVERKISFGVEKPWMEFASIMVSTNYQVRVLVVWLRAKLLVGVGIYEAGRVRKLCAERERKMR